MVSQARSAAPVSVEQYGLPVPQAKMTMRPSSKCRSALRRMNGSATLIMFSAVCTRTGTPRCSMASCMASELMTVASMPMWSAVVRSMLVPCLPRQKLPPPMTMPTSTPIACTRMSWSTTPAMIFSSRPKPASPASASPESFKMILLYLGVLLCIFFSLSVICLPQYFLKKGTQCSIVCPLFVNLSSWKLVFRLLPRGRLSSFRCLRPSRSGQSGGR